MNARFLTAMVAIIVIGALNLPTLADESFEPISGVDVLNATATPAAIGETSRLRFRLENFSSSDLTLIGVRSKTASSGAIAIADGSGGSADTETLMIKQEETIDLETSHIWLELRGAKSRLSAGDTIPFELLFRNGIVPGIADVHPAPH